MVKVISGVSFMIIMVNDKTKQRLTTPEILHSFDLASRVKVDNGTNGEISGNNPIILLN